MNIFDSLKAIARPLASLYFETRDKIIIPPYSEKRSILLNYQNRYALSILIETGTFLGNTIEAFKDDFAELYSFELSADLAAKAKERFKNYKHISIINEDSGKYLSKLLSQIQKPCLFWLDGHYSSEFFLNDEYIKTAKGDKETPIMEELAAIFEHGMQGHVILIDDARCFNGRNDYPTLQALRKFVGQRSPNAHFEVKRDIIRITPK